jgi:hypothetical protein
LGIDKQSSSLLLKSAARIVRKSRAAFGVVILIAYVFEPVRIETKSLRASQCTHLNQRILKEEARPVLPAESYSGYREHYHHHRLDISDGIREFIWGICGQLFGEGILYRSFFSDKDSNILKKYQKRSSPRVLCSRPRPKTGPLQITWSVYQDGALLHYSVSSDW